MNEMLISVFKTSKTKLTGKSVGGFSGWLLRHRSTACATRDELWAGQRPMLCKSQSRAYSEPKETDENMSLPQVVVSDICMLT